MAVFGGLPIEYIRSNVSDKSSTDDILGKQIHCYIIKLE